MHLLWHQVHSVFEKECFTCAKSVICTYSAELALTLAFNRERKRAELWNGLYLA
jgi:hypothetical protein